MAKRVTFVLLGALAAGPAYAQQGPNAIGVRGFATLGAITFQAEDSFDAILERHAAPIVGGGAQVLLPGGIFVEVAASRFKRAGEQAFVTASGEVFRLGIPVDVSITPLDRSATRSAEAVSRQRSTKTISGHDPATEDQPWPVNQPSRAGC